MSESQKFKHVFAETLFTILHEDASKENLEALNACVAAWREKFPKFSKAAMGQQPFLKLVVAAVEEAYQANAELEQMEKEDAGHE